MAFEQGSGILEKQCRKKKAMFTMIAQFFLRSMFFSLFEQTSLKAFYMPNFVLSTEDTCIGNSSHRQGTTRDVESFSCYVTYNCAISCASIGCHGHGTNVTPISIVA